MPVFAYEAVDDRARLQRGTLVADSLPAARGQLRDRRWAVTRLETRSSPRATQLRWQRRGDWSEFWRDVQVLLATGVPLVTALQTSCSSLPPAGARVIQEVVEEIKGGRGLAQSLAAHAGWFDGLTHTLIAVGEQAGRLPQALGELANYLERQKRNRGRLANALVYPAFLVLVGTAVLIFLMTSVVPQLTEVLTSAGRPLPWPTRLVQSAGDLVTGYWPLLLLLVAAVAGLFVIIHRHPRGRRQVEWLLLSVPVLGDLHRKQTIARLSLGLSTLLKSDVRFVEAVATLRRTLPDGLYADELKRLEQAVERGVDLASPLAESKLFPRLFVHLMGVGQTSGELPLVLTQLRDKYETEVEHARTRFIATLEPTLTVILAALIGLVVFATVLPILETTRIVQ